MYLNQILELVQLSFQITTQDHLQKWPLEISITTCLHGLSAFFQTVRILFTTLHSLVHKLQG
uniref:Uncharacterized protein n=1 Tax=Rhizophora mucronata TaxID=61149 RepID=A0A2P2Q3H8_RHIMU